MRIRNLSRKLDEGEKRNKHLNNLNYVCPKCSNTQYEIGEFRAAGGFWSKIFDVQGARFSTVSCRRCRYTEIYKADSHMLGNIFDFFTN
ncbi:MAG: GTP-binding protein [candidate division Zixibacteria bacterium]|nr:GTP-binding protein [candidate division Zixibacteria bacterium]